MNKTACLSFCFSLLAFFLRSQNFSEKDKTHQQLSFKENKGQVSDQNFKPRPDVLFSGTDGKIRFHLKANGISYQLDRVDTWITKRSHSHAVNKHPEWTVPGQRTIYRIDVSWLNTAVNPQIIKGESLPGFENYYGETCPGGALSVKGYKNVLYKDLYPGIDLKWYEKEGALEYDYYIAAFADYKKIRLEYKGAEKIYVDKTGALIIQTPLGNISEQKPLVIQNNRKLEAGWKVENNTVSFDIKNVDPALPVVIDPMVRLWGTYYGGASDDIGFSLNTDNSTNVYMTGWTESASNIATSGAHQVIYGGSGAGDAFVVKFDPTGVRQWATYYGGAEDDYGMYAKIDGSGNVHMVGGTATSNSAVIATPGAHQSTAPGSTSSVSIDDAYLVKFNASGVRQWGTYYGGSSYDFAVHVDVDAAGDILVTGCTGSSDGTSIATPGSHQPAYAGGQEDGYIAKFNAAGVRLWSTYYGGNGIDIDEPTWGSMAANGDIYLSGYTNSQNGITTPGSHQPVFGGGTYDAFAAKFNSAGVRQWGTYYGGPGIEYLGPSAVDAAGNIYLSGATTSTGNAISTPGCHQAALVGIQDAMFIKLDASGVRQWGTYYGGAGFEYSGCASFDATGNIYFTGNTATQSGTGIATHCAYQSSYGGGSSDAFLTKFTPAGTRIWGSYFGSIYSDEYTASTSDLHGDIYVAGTTLANSGTVMVTPGAHQSTFSGHIEIFLEKFDGCVPGSAVNMTPPSNLLVCPGETTTLSASCGNWYSSPTGTTVLSAGGTFTTGPLSADTTFYVEDFACGASTGTRTAVSVTLVPSNLSVTNSNPLACVGESVTLTASGASSYTWTGPFGSSSASTLQVYILLHSNYSVTATDAEGCVSAATIAVIPDLCLGMKENKAAAVAVFPNPNNGAFYVSGLTEQKLVLTNELGQEIRKVILSASNNFTVLLEELPNGVYFLKGEKDSGVLSKKVVVIR